MLKIEVIKFEAQDVITASAVAKPVEPKCICNTPCQEVRDTITESFIHGEYEWTEDKGWIADPCKATEHVNCN